MSDNPAATTPRLNQLAAEYDILAVRPVDEKTFQQACTTLDCDLISLDASQRLGFILKHRTLSAALQRGIRLELCYAGATAGGGNSTSSSLSMAMKNSSDMTADPAARRNLIANATALIRATRGGRGLVISSEARRAAACRAPWDVVNLAIVWGLGQERAKEAVANTARAVVVTARLKRSSYRGAVDVIDGGGGGGSNGRGAGGGASRGGGRIGDGKSYDDNNGNEEHKGKGTTTTITTIATRKRKAVGDVSGDGTAAAVTTTTTTTTSQQPSKRELKRQAKRARTESTAAAQ